MGIQLITENDGNVVQHHSDDFPESGRWERTNKITDGIKDAVCSVKASHVEKILDNAFVGCTKLSRVVIGNGVDEIGRHAFLGCEALQQVTLSPDVTMVSNGAFACCSSLDYLCLSEGLQPSTR